jgi:hypothetical protein
MEIAMTEYRLRLPRVAFGCAAMAMTAFTLVVLVILPSQFENAGQPSVTLALSRATVASIRTRVQFLWRRPAAAVARRGPNVASK